MLYLAILMALPDGEPVQAPQPRGRGGRPYPIQMFAQRAPRDDDGKSTIEITLKIAPEALIYANPIGLKELEATATRIRFTTPDGKAITSTIDYPRGKLVEDDIIGNYRIYTGTVVIRAVLTGHDPKKPIRVSCTQNGMQSAGV